ncbi:MAG: ABC transporter substrate-binding protein [Gammaproteobacteria bacterium]
MNLKTLIIRANAFLSFSVVLNVVLMGFISGFSLINLAMADPEAVATTTSSLTTAPASAASASPSSPSSSTDLLDSLPSDPYELVKVVTDRLLKKLEHYQALESDKEREAFSREVVEQTFAIMIDFDLIARRVMAKHYQYASAAQRQAFATVFRESLINTYASAMSSYSNQKIMIQPFEGIDEEGRRRRAKVDMHIRTADGDVYPVEYALYEAQSGRWKVENLILNGVNIGLTFRNQFSEALRKNKGNIDDVIRTWSSKVAEL